MACAAQGAERSVAVIVDMTFHPKQKVLAGVNLQERLARTVAIQQTNHPSTYTSRFVVPFPLQSVPNILYSSSCSLPSSPSESTTAVFTASAASLAFVFAPSVAAFAASPIPSASGA